MSRIRSIIFMLCSVSMFVSIYTGDTTDADATKEEAPEQKQSDTAPEAAPKEEKKPGAQEEATETQPEPEATPESPPEDEPQEEPLQQQEPEVAEVDKVVLLEPQEEEPLPLPPEPAEEPMVEDLEAVEPEGIDTVDINEPEGNWLFKRIWWERSRELFGKIRDYVDKIVESRMHFFEQRVKLDRDQIDPFYVAIGLDQGALIQQVDHLLSGLQHVREQDGVLNEQELEWYHILKENKKTLDQLHDAVVDIQRIDSNLDQSLQILMEQINLARAYEREAWQLLNQIAEELSDKKAREDYYAIATIWRNVKEVGAYITEQFAKHFVRLASSTVQRIDQIQDTIELLKQKGIELSKVDELLYQQQCEVEDDEDIEKEEELTAPVSWFDWIWQAVTSWFTW